MSWNNHTGSGPRHTMMPLPLRRLVWWFAVGNLLVSIFMLPLSLGQRISASNRRRQYDFANNRPEIFYDTRMMSDGHEETVYLIKGETESYNFLLEEGGVPLSIMVTPCASNITFVLFNRAMTSSSEESDPEDTFSTQMEGQSLVRVEEFKGGGNMVYTTRHARKGIYILSLQAINTDTTVKLFATTRPESVSLFPQLPSDAKIRVTRTTRRSVKFSWNPSSIQTELPPQPPSLEYCVSVNKVMNFHSHCSVLAHLKGDTFPKPPRFSGFGFTNEKTKYRERLMKAKPIKAMSRKRLFYTCVGSKTNFTFDKAKPETSYFIDIYAVDKNTNRSSTYVGTVVQTKKRKRRQALLKSEKRKTVTLQKGVRSVSVKLVLTKQVEKGVLELKACRGVLPFEVLYDNKLIHKSEVRRIKIVRMNLPAGTYILRFKGKRKRKRSVMVFFTESGRYHPPRLPMDYRIKVFDSRTTCTNVTLAWMGNNVKQKYCLYKKELVNNQKVRKHRCSDPGHRSKKEKVFCTRFRHRQPSKAVISKTVTGLKPDTNYLFDVYVSRGNSASLVYLNQQVRTKTKCET